MSVELRQLVQEQIGVNPKDPKLRIEYVAFGSEDRLEVVAAIEDEVPDTLAGLSFLYTDADYKGGGTWFGVAHYGTPEGVPIAPQGGGTPPPGSPPTVPPPPTPEADQALGNEWSFTTTGATKRMYQSLRTHQKVKIGGGTAPDFKNAINVTKDGVEGVDVVSPKMEITYTARCPAITLNYLKTLYELTGTYNTTPFFYFPIGDVLFLGADGAFRHNEGFTLTYHFGVFKGGEVTVCESPLTKITVYGTSYVWVTYTESESNGVKVKTPFAVYEEQVYFGADLAAQLGIGGGNPP